MLTHESVSLVKTDLLQVLETLAVSLADASTMAYSAVLLSTLCLSSGGSAAEVSGTLGLSAQDQYNIRKADILKIAQLVWSSSAGQPKAAIAAQASLLIPSDLSFVTIVPYTCC